MTETRENKRVVILAMGGGGGKIMQSIAFSQHADWFRLLYLDTDQYDLDTRTDMEKLVLGEEWAKYQGCGGDTKLGENSTSAGIDKIRLQLQGVELLIVVGCLGQGLASGGMPVVARLAREMGILCFFFVTLPFAFEGNTRRETADRSLPLLRKNTDIVIALQNDLLFTAFPADTGALDAFKEADRIIAAGVLGTAELVRCRGLISVDLAHLKTLLKQKDATCSFGLGRMNPDAPDDFPAMIENLLEFPLLGGREFLDSADVVVATLIGGLDLQIGQMNNILNILNSHISSHTKSVLGANIVTDRKQPPQVTMLAIRYQRAEPPVPEKKKASSKRKTQRGKVNELTRQFKLPFEEDAKSLGIFGNVSATPYNGENLDIPTFQRHGVVLDLD